MIIHPTDPIERGWLPSFRASPVLPPPPVLFGFLLVLSSNFHIFGTKL
nr:MAG TPA: hypothetical protein [Caudoviricetes sp.]DAT05863.1 MAG TPA: hypothetical protein [Caudoviricetes sp.]